MATWWLSTLGNDANPGTSYNTGLGPGSGAKATLAGIMALGDLATGDIVNVVRDGDHRWTTHATRAVAKAGVVGTDFGLNYGLIIRGTDEFGNPAPAVVKADVLDGATARSWLAYAANTVGWYIFRNLIFDATTITAHSQEARCLFWDVPGNVEAPVKFEGCEVWGAALGSWSNGARKLIAVNGIAGALVRLFSEVDGCYFQNVTAIGDFAGGHKQHWRNFVIYHDVTNSPFYMSLLGLQTGSISVPDVEQQFHNFTIYANGPASLNTIIDYSIATTRANVGSHTFQNALIFHQRATPGAVANHLMRDTIGNTTSTIVRNIGGNVRLFGTNVTSYTGTDGHYTGIWDEDRNESTGNDPWATDTVQLNVQEATVFANPTSGYAWDPLGNGVQIIIPKDLRPIGALATAGIGGTTPGALPAYIPITLDWIRTLPEAPVVETWDWRTSVVTSRNGVNEQRMALRMQPRKRIEFDLFLEDETQRREEYRRLYQALDGQILIPFFQYATSLTQNASIGASKLFYNPAKTDIRSNELVVIYRPSTKESFLIELGTAVSDGANTQLTLSQQFFTTDVIIPTFRFTLDNQGGINMRSVTGKLHIGAKTGDIRSSFPRPGSSAVITTFDSLNILDRRPLANDDVPELFDRLPEIFDNETGVYYEEMHWLHSFINGSRQFFIRRFQDPAEMDYWRDFLHSVRGMREPFLLPTFRQDLVLNTNPSSSSSTIDVLTLNYDSKYFPYDTYKRVRLEAPNGDILYRKINSVLVLSPTVQRLTLDTALPGTSPWGSGFNIGYLNRVRLGSDQVRLTHQAINTILEIVVRTTDT